MVRNERMITINGELSRGGFHGTSYAGMPFCQVRDDDDNSMASDNPMR